MHLGLAGVFRVRFGVISVQVVCWSCALCISAWGSVCFLLCPNWRARREKENSQVYTRLEDTSNSVDSSSGLLLSELRICLEPFEHLVQDWGWLAQLVSDLSKKLFTFAQQHHHTWSHLRFRGIPFCSPKYSWTTLWSVSWPHGSFSRWIKPLRRKTSARKV